MQELRAVPTSGISGMTVASTECCGRSSRLDCTTLVVDLRTGSRKSPRSCFTDCSPLSFSTLCLARIFFSVGGMDLYTLKLFKKESDMKREAKSGLPSSNVVVAMPARARRSSVFADQMSEQYAVWHENITNVLAEYQHGVSPTFSVACVYVHSI